MVPERKQKQEVFKHYLTIKVRDELLSHWITPNFSLANFFSAPRPSVQKAGLFKLNQEVAHDCSCRSQMK